MNDSSLILGASGVGRTHVAVLLLQPFIAPGEIGRRRWILNGIVLVALTCALAAIDQGAGLVSGTLAGLSLLVGVVYFVLLALSGQSKQVPAVAVGSPLPGFSAPDENDQVFDLASLEGRPVLLKFFRGHW
jgi:hypothetical protein